MNPNSGPGEKNNGLYSVTTKMCHHIFLFGRWLNELQPKENDERLYLTKITFVADKSPLEQILIIVCS